MSIISNIYSDDWLRDCLLIKQGSFGYWLYIEEWLNTSAFANEFMSLIIVFMVYYWLHNCCKWECARSLCYQLTLQVLKMIIKRSMTPTANARPWKNSINNQFFMLTHRHTFTCARLRTCTFCPCWGTSSSSVQSNRLLQWNKRPKLHFNGLHPLISIFKRAGTKSHVFHLWSQYYSAGWGWGFQKTHLDISWLCIL